MILWSAWYGTQNDQANGCGAPNGCGNAGGEQSRFHTVHGPGGMTPQVAAYQQILNLLPTIGGPQLLSLRQVLHDAHGQVRNLPENFGGNVYQSSSKIIKYVPSHARSLKSSLKQLHMQKHPKATQNASFMHFLNSGKLQTL